ncbi:MAG: hypothetical protein IT452_05620 [Planctomycetia bacterium]|nr:hypothetical protein [Planctomycetia bacterium]
MNAWNRFWFATTGRHSIGFFRVLLCAWLCADYLDFLPGLDSLLGRGGTFLAPSAGLRAALRLIPGTDLRDVGEIGRALAWVLAPLALFGVGTRFSLLLLAVVNFALRAWHSSWVYVGHASILPSLALFILAFAPGVRAWSVDALLEAWRDRRRGRPLLEALAGPPAAVWPVHLLLACAAVLYASAGVAKLRWGGRDWITGRTLQWYLEGNAGQKRLGDSTQFFSARRDAPPEARFRDPWGLDKIANSTMSTPAGRAIATSLPLCAAASWGALLLELAFPLVFFLRRPAQYALLASAALFHAGIGALMGIDFGGWAVLYLVAVDWNALLTRPGAFLPGLHSARAGS